MPDLSFQIEEVVAMRRSATPALAARLRIANARADEPVQSVSLNCQVMIEPLGRSYSAAEEARLLELFGEREQWARSMTPLLWTNVVLRVPAFREYTIVDIPLPCTLDFDLAATKYFYGLEQGAVRISVVFSGTVFYTRADSALQVMPIPWQSEARFRMTAELWRQAIDAHYPDHYWLRLPRETFERLYLYRIDHHLPAWSELVEHLLDRAERNDRLEPTALQDELRNPTLLSAGGER